MSWGRFKRSKYGVRQDPAGVAKRTRNGRTFASQKEAKRYDGLLLLELSGQISDLVLQPRFPIVVNEVHICTYIADFRYQESGKEVIEDSKGFKTPEFILKWKLVQVLYPELTFRLT